MHLGDCETDAPPEARQFEILTTGEKINSEKFIYWGTAQLASGTMVYHIFESTLRGLIPISKEKVNE